MAKSGRRGSLPRKLEQREIRQRVREALPLNLAVHLRRKSTSSEKALWHRLRDRRLGGLKFRRQHRLGPYFADFYCDEARLVVELDGESHDGRVERDAARDRWMRERGIEVMRVKVREFADDSRGVLGWILKCARERIERLRRDEVG